MKYDYIRADGKTIRMDTNDDRRVTFGRCDSCNEANLILYYCQPRWGGNMWACEVCKQQYGGCNDCEMA